jgi:hypothetical protein
MNKLSDKVAEFHREVEEIRKWVEGDFLSITKNVEQNTEQIL